MEGKAYLADLGGRFASDTHRRVLAHLSYPDDDYGWSASALVLRMWPDQQTSIDSVEEMQSILHDLETDGHAHQPADGVFQMTEDGFKVLTGPIANEPPPGAEVQGPAMINGPGAATSLNGDRPAGSQEVRS